MTKKVIIVHGWEGSPNELMIKEMGLDLEKEGFKVIIPEMPDPEHPEINAWVKTLKGICKTVDRNTYFIGHSIGCQTILRFIEKLTLKTRIGGTVFIAPWITLNSETIAREGPKIGETSKAWLETPINFDKIKRIENKFFCIFSDNDQYVPLTNRELFEKNLNARCIIERNKGHFTTSDGSIDNKLAVHEILNMSKRI